MEPNAASILMMRETMDKGRVDVRQKLQVTKAMIARLGLEKELKLHTGCVNCLEWNSRGDILASASDDVQVILWDPFKRTSFLNMIRTGHQGNIFTVKFMPQTGDTLILTGAADYKIMVHDQIMEELRMVCSCHCDRVKRLATAPNDPFVFLSAAEDGCIMHFDLRTKHYCNSDKSTAILINLNNHMGAGAEAKCLAINPTRPEHLAVGANDPFVRLYDRRMIKQTAVPYRSQSGGSVHSWERRSLIQSRAGLGDEDENIPWRSVQYYAPGHLPGIESRSGRSGGKTVTTYLTFSADGSELLVNLGGEQIYLFDVNSNRRPFSYFIPQKDESKVSKDFPLVPVAERDLQAKIARLKEIANGHFKSKSYFKAINLYNEAIALSPRNATLYANRAAALMKRKWDGDEYAAYRDCTTALALDPSYMKAHFRLITCLTALHKIDLARKSLSEFALKFPDELASTEYKKLAEDIEVDAVMLKNHEEEKDFEDEMNDLYFTPRPVQSESEKCWRSDPLDYKLFFCGHCNTTTDIKEANFFGSNAQFIMAGSDDGSFFIWDRKTTNIIKVLRGDESIVNCLQPHPSTCLLATSGIDESVKLWSPRPENAEPDPREVKEMEVAAALNQKRMRTDPFEMVLTNMRARADNGEEGSACRQS